MLQPNQKTLSVIIPVYNTEKYVRRCLDSLTYNRDVVPQLELILVNDGSSDSSLAILQEYEQEFPNSVFVINKENGGHGSAINAGVKRATGKYFRIVDSDDWVNIDDFGRFVNSLAEIEADLVVTNYVIEKVWSSQTFRFSYDCVRTQQVYDVNSFDFALLQADYFTMASNTIKTSIFKDNGITIDEGIFYVDMEYIIFTFEHVNTFIYLDYDIYRYYIGRPEQSVNAASFVKRREDHEQVMLTLLKHLQLLEKGTPRYEYILKIISLMNLTHYNIYLGPADMSTAERSEIVEFDRREKQLSPDLYELTSANSRSIRYFRKTNFILLRLNCMWLYRLTASVLGRR